MPTMCILLLSAQVLTLPGVGLRKLRPLCHCTSHGYSSKVQGGTVPRGLIIRLLNDLALTNTHKVNHMHMISRFANCSAALSHPRLWCASCTADNVHHHSSQMSACLTRDASAPPGHQPHNLPKLQYAKPRPSSGTRTLTTRMTCTSCTYVVSGQLCTVLCTQCLERHGKAM